MKTKKILIVPAPYYSDIISEMVKKVEEFLDVSDELYKVKVKHEFINAPGVFEIPVVISKHIKKYDGIIAFGCVIKGETPHFDYISKAAIDGIMKLSIEYKKPIGNGIITCLNMDQAIKRSKKKGQEAAGAMLAVLCGTWPYDTVQEITQEL